MKQSLAALLAVFSSLATGQTQIAFINGRWFNGTSFDQRTAFSVQGRLTFKRPKKIDQTIDLAGSWVVPAYGEGHNHSVGTGIEARDQAAIQRFVADGVLFARMQGNLPLSDEARRRLARGHVNLTFAQGSITGEGGHPIALTEMLLERGGYYPGFTKLTLKDYCYFTVQTERELEDKWPKVLALHPDFIKTFLWFSDEYDRRRDDPHFFGQKALDPALLPVIVRKAHAGNLRVSTHVTNTPDFHNALIAGADEISHLPIWGPPISLQDADLAARLRVVVNTTCTLVRTLPRSVLREDEVPGVVENQKRNLRLLHDRGVRLAIGSDNVRDSSAGEVEYLHSLGVFDNLTLLRMWTQTSKTIFPDRRVGELTEGFEATFLALEGDPVADFQNFRRIRMRFANGIEVPGGKDGS